MHTAARTPCHTRSRSVKAATRDVPGKISRQPAREQHYSRDRVAKSQIFWRAKHRDLLLVVLLYVHLRSVLMMLCRMHVVAVR